MDWAPSRERRSFSSPPVGGGAVRGGPRSNRVAKGPLRYAYIAHYETIFDNCLESSLLAVYLNPVPPKIAHMYAQVPNTAYVIEQEVSAMCPDVVQISKNLTPHSRGHQLQIHLDGVDSEHPYGLPLIFRLQVKAGPVNGVNQNVRAYNTMYEDMAVGIEEEKKDTVQETEPEVTDPAYTLTVDKLALHTQEVGASPRPSSPASSVGSSGSTVKPDIIEKVDRWKQALTTTGEPDSTQATRSSILFDSYVAYCGGVNKCGVKRSNDFGKYIRALWPEGERAWSKKDGTYYRGISLRS